VYFCGLGPAAGRQSEPLLYGIVKLIISPYRASVTPLSHLRESKTPKCHLKSHSIRKNLLYKLSRCFWTFSELRNAFPLRVPVRLQETELRERLQL